VKVRLHLNNEVKFVLDLHIIVTKISTRNFHYWDQTSTVPLVTL